MGGSGVIPGWKVRRELHRLGQQLRAIPEALWEPFVYGRYDRRFPADLQVIDGGQASRPDVALVLIFPQPRLPESTLSLCGGLARAGFAPLVISNAPLDEGDLARLAPHVWRIVVRPNLGHDFGGYRDGIRLLWHWDIRPERLLVLNDSVWLYDNDPAALVATLDAIEADVVGSILRQKGEVRFLESYCYMMRGAALASPAFRRFWQDLRLTSNKSKVIRRGERGHSVALAAGGLRIAPAFGNRAFLAQLAQADDARLDQMLRFAAFLTDADARQGEALRNRRGAANWRADVLAFVEKRLEKGQFYSLFPVAARDAGYPFLKRSGDRVARLWRRACLDAVHAGAIAPPAPVILAELEARVAKDG